VTVVRTRLTPSADSADLSELEIRLEVRLPEGLAGLFVMEAKVGKEVVTSRQFGMYREKGSSSRSGQPVIKAIIPRPDPSVTECTITLRPALDDMQDLDQRFKAIWGEDIVLEGVKLDRSDLAVGVGRRAVGRDSRRPRPPSPGVGSVSRRPRPPSPAVFAALRRRPLPQAGEALERASRATDARARCLGRAVPRSSGARVERCPGRMGL
jgi:hypothetical protein